MSCEICGVAEAKYKCPACGCRTCSLECVRRHKIERNCTGQKPKTEFVPMNKMNAEILQRDIALYDRANVAVVDASDKLDEFKKVPKYKKNLKKECADRGIDLNFMPSLSSRHRTNESCISKENKEVILWTICWRFYTPEKKIIYERIVPRTEDTVKIGLILRGIIETSPDDYVSKLDPNDLVVLMLGERLENGSYYELDNDFSLNDSLCGKTVIEYPIFAVVDKADVKNWKIAPPFAIGAKVEEAKEERKDNEKDEEDDIGPDYEEIKKSLKLDLIASFNQSFEEKQDK